MSAPKIDGLVEGPVETFTGFWAERWLTDTTEHRLRAERRRRALSRALPRATVAGKKIQVVKRWSIGLGADRMTLAGLELTYCAPNGAPPVTEEQLAQRPRKVILPVMDDVEAELCPVARSA